MSKAKQSMKDAVREWAKTAPANELEAMRDMLELAATFRGLGISDGDAAAFNPPKRGRPPGSRNRPKEQDKLNQTEGYIAAIKQSAAD